MTATAAARVEVLTAEVRVLMVGSRQVTMSVYDQLDQVKPGEIEPFGRVAPRDAGSGWVNVVGVSARDADRGTLVRATCQSAGTLRWRAERCRRLATLTERRDRTTRQRDEIRAAEGRSSEYTRLGRELMGFEWELENAGVAKLSACELTAEAQEFEDGAGTAALWEALPLIVLAGLR